MAYSLSDRRSIIENTMKVVSSSMAPIECTTPELLVYYTAIKNLYTTTISTGYLFGNARITNKQTYSCIPLTS